MLLGRIGVFDSGVGGLTVASRLMSEAPHLALHYFGDTAHVPYGNRPAEEVTRLVEDITDYLVRSGVSAVVMACNTSNALAIDRIRQWCPVPLIGIIEPAARAAVQATRNGRIGVIANPITAASGAYERAAAAVPACKERLLKVYPVGCPKLVPLIETGRVNSPEAREALMEYLEPLIERSVDTLVLGCTHYPFLTHLIRDIMGPDVVIIDPGASVIHELCKHGVTRTQTQGHIFEVSGCPGDFETHGSRLIGYHIQNVRQVTGLTPPARIAV
jgi:glutamate racemase